MSTQRFTAIVMICFVSLLSGLVYASSSGSQRLALSDDTAMAATPVPTPLPAGGTTQFEFTVQGPVVANELYRSSIITITPTSRTLTIYATYTNQPILTQNLDNNDAAYNQLWGALQTTGFPNRIGNHGDPGSNCPNGLRYTYTVLGPGNQSLIQTWATSCGNQGEPFSGNVGAVNQLIRNQIPGIAQIPDYQAFIQ